MSNQISNQHMRILTKVHLHNFGKSTEKPSWGSLAGTGGFHPNYHRWWLFPSRCPSRLAKKPRSAIKRKPPDDLIDPQHVEPTSRQVIFENVHMHCKGCRRRVCDQEPDHLTPSNGSKNRLLVHAVCRQVIVAVQRFAVCLEQNVPANTQVNNEVKPDHAGTMLHVTWLDDH